MALTTAANLRSAEGGLSDADSETNAWLETLIGVADDWIAEFCGYPPASVGAARTIEQATYTAYSGDGVVVADASDPRLLRLRVWPVASIVSIHEDGDEEYGAGTEVSSSDYAQRGRRGQHVRLKPSASHGAWSSSPRAIKVVFTAGYVAADHPRLMKASTELALMLYKLNGRRGHQSISDGRLNTSHRPEKMPASVRQMLAGYRLPGVVL